MAKIVSNKKHKLKFKEININEIASFYSELSALENSGECRADLCLAYFCTYWNLVQKPKFTKINGNIVLDLHDVETQENYICLVGSHKLPETIDTVFAYLVENGREAIINMLDEATVSLLRNCANLKIIHNRYLDEYILSVEDHALLKKKSLRNSRQAVQKFLKYYNDEIRIFELDLNDTSSVISLINSMHTWDVRANSANNDPGRVEKKYIEKLLTTINITGLRNMAVCYEDQIIGFILYSLDEKKKFCIPHAIKVNYGFRHSFDFLLYALACKLKTAGIEYINAEEDMGAEGIRFKKMHLAPIKMYRRYSITSVLN